MLLTPYLYATEKFANARRNIMLGIAGSQAENIAHAYHEITLGLQGVRSEHLGPDQREWVRRLRELMDTTGISDPAERGTWHIKAERLTKDEKVELVVLVDDLADWFRRKLHEELPE